MERTQIYMTEEQKRNLSVLSKKTGESQSVLIRKALDEYLSVHGVDAAKKQNDFLKSHAGMWADRDDLDDFVDIRRVEAESRLARVHGGLSEPDQAPYQGKPKK